MSAQQPLSQKLHLQQETRFLVTLIVLGLLLIFCTFLGTLWGPATSFFQALQSSYQVFTQGQLAQGEGIINDLIYQIRLPRVFLGLIAGAGFAVSGGALQVLFNNPLADSGLIGINSGAMLGVIFGILFAKVFGPLNTLMIDFPHLFLPFLAFLGACLLGGLVYRLSLNNGRINVAIMLLAGVAVNAFAGAFSGLMITTANDEQLRTITFWSMGSLNGADWKIVTFLGGIVIVGSIALIRLHKELDAMALGEREALYLGVNTDSVKKRVLILSALICGPIVSYVGLIGFVGLVVPHILRLFLGPKTKQLLISSFVLGSIFLILSDVFAKNVITPSELPIGIVTALVGTPFFTYLLLKQKRRVG